MTFPTSEGVTGVGSDNPPFVYKEITTSGSSRVGDRERHHRTQIEHRGETDVLGGGMSTGSEVGPTRVKSRGRRRHVRNGRRMGTDVVVRVE